MYEQDERDDAKEELGDYETCSICGHDHEYDFAYLGGEEVRAAMQAHAVPLRMRSK